MSRGEKKSELETSAGLLPSEDNMPCFIYSSKIISTLFLQTALPMGFNTGVRKLMRGGIFPPPTSLATHLLDNTVLQNFFN